MDYIWRYAEKGMGYLFFTYYHPAAEKNRREKTPSLVSAYIVGHLCFENYISATASRIS